MGTPEEQARRTRAEARTHAREAGTKANAETAARLAAALATAPAEHRPWFELERIGYAAESGADAPAVETAAKAVLTDIPATSEEPLDRLRARRATLVLAYLATRRRAPEGLADRVVAWLTEREAAKDPRFDPRAELFRLLVALDRADALEKALAGWIRPEEADLTWRMALAYLQAETGRLPEAVVTLETASTLGDLDADAWSLLANGYFLAKEDARRERALVRALEAVPEWQLNQRLWQESSRVERSGPGVPAELDPTPCACSASTCAPQSARRRPCRTRSACTARRRTSGSSRAWPTASWATRPRRSTSSSAAWAASSARSTRRRRARRSRSA